MLTLRLVLGSNIREGQRHFGSYNYLGCEVELSCSLLHLPSFSRLDWALSLAYLAFGTIGTKGMTSFKGFSKHSKLSYCAVPMLVL